GTPQVPRPQSVGAVGVAGKVNANGHRRRQVRARVLAEEDLCALCDLPVDKTLPHLDPMAAVVDEDIPRSRGGSQYERSNCHLMHRAHNQWKGTMTLAQARAKWHGGAAQRLEPAVEASPIW